jgi:hypothetical protein
MQGFFVVKFCHMVTQKKEYIGKKIHPSLQYFEEEKS